MFGHVDPMGDPVNKKAYDRGHRRRPALQGAAWEALQQDTQARIRARLDRAGEEEQIQPDLSTGTRLCHGWRDR